MYLPVIEEHLRLVPKIGSGGRCETPWGFFVVRRSISGFWTDVLEALALNQLPVTGTPGQGGLLGLRFVAECPNQDMIGASITERGRRSWP